MINLFPDQQEMIDDLRDAMRYHKSILLQSETGSGKTIVAIWLLIQAAKKNKNVMFTVPRRELFKQTSQTFTKYGVSHGYIASGKPLNPYASSYVGMIDTMARRIKMGDDGLIIGGNLPHADMVIIDESHFGQNNLNKVIKWYQKQGAWVIGLSATPWKLSGQGLGCWYNHMVQGKSMRWLIDNKRLSDYRYFYGKTAPDLSKLKVTAGDYAKGEVASLMEEQGKIIGDCVSDYRERAFGRLHIVRCASIKHSQMTAESFRNAGIPAMHVDGTTDDNTMRRIIQAYARREILVLTFCDLLNFGWDLSQASGMDVCVESCSDLKPSMSLAGQKQFWGRVFRYKDYPAIIMDHVNNWRRHDLPCEDREWTLADRKQTKKSSSEVIPKSKQCPACYFVHRPTPSCPECGHLYKIKSRIVKEVEGNLCEINPKTTQQKRQKSIKSLADDLMYNKDNMNLKKNDEATLEYLIEKFTRDNVKNPAAKAAYVLAARMRKSK